MGSNEFLDYTALASRNGWEESSERRGAESMRGDFRMHQPDLHAKDCQGLLNAHLW